MEEEVADVADWSAFKELATHPMVIRLAVLLVAILVILTVTGLIRRALNRTIADTDRKYKARKAVNMLTYLVIVVTALIIYSDRLGNIGVALGVAGAGIAFALQEVIVSVAGWLTIMIGGFISVGQRVKIGDVRGDVIDIGVFSTTIMETGDWVDGDLYNGRIVTMSNAFVYKEKIHNYSAEYPFLWDEMKVPIRLESDMDQARQMFREVLEEVCGEYTDRSKQRWLSLTNKFRVETARVEPMVSMQFDENWATFTLRYIVDYKLRRATKDRIATALLQRLKQDGADVQVAASTIEVTHINPSS